MREGVNGAYPLQTLDDQELTFFSDVDSDGDTEKIRYYLIGNTLYRQVYEYDEDEYACQDGCNVCHQGSSLSITETDWPSYGANGDEIDFCGSGNYGSSGSINSTSEKVLAENVDISNPLFEYYNGDWPGDTLNNPLIPVNRLLDTRYIKIIVTIDNSSTVQGTQPVTIETATQLRNLKNNL